MGALQPMSLADLDAELPEQDVALRRSIWIHLPNEGEARMSLRVEIAKIRDTALSGLSRCSDASAGTLNELARLATFLVFAPMNTRRLWRWRFALRLMLETARELERAGK